MSNQSLDPCMSKMEILCLEQPCIHDTETYVLRKPSHSLSSISYGKRLARLYTFTNCLKAVWHFRIIHAYSIIISHLSKGKSHQEFNESRIHHGSVQILTYTDINTTFINGTNSSLSLSRSYRFINRTASYLNWPWLLRVPLRG